MEKEIVPIEPIENKIYIIRGQKVMLDGDLAGLYGVLTFRLNEQVKRNINRFPKDFMFQITKEEWENLISQIAISSSRFQIGTLNEDKEKTNLKFQIGTSSWGGARKLPYVFTEHGILMLSSVLNSQRAIDVNIKIMRTFSRLRQLMSNNKELSAKLEQIEKRVLKHDGDIRELVRDIRRLSGVKSGNVKNIGFLK